MAKQETATKRPRTKSEPKTTAKNGASDVLDVLLRLLEDARGERRCAAAIVLAELAPNEDDVLDGLRKATRRTDDPQLRRYATEALGAIAPKSIAKDLQHLLKDPDRDVRETVSRVLASGRGVTAADIARMLEDGDEKERIAAIGVLGAMGGREARKRLLSQLAGASTKVTNAVLDALRSSLLVAQGADATHAIEDIEAALDRETIVEEPESAIAVVQLLSFIPNDASAEVLLSIASSKAAPEVRANAIEAIRKVVKGKKPDAKLFKFLLEVVESKSEAGPVVGAAIDALSGLEVPLALEPRVRALVSSESTIARRWAIRALGDLDTAPAARGLSRVVETGDPADREAALESAKRTTSGRQELARLLARSTDESRARLVAGALKTFGPGLEQGTRQILEDSVVEARPEIAEIIVELLKHVGGKSVGTVQDSLLEKALKLKKKGLYHDAIAIFRSICRGQSSDPEARFQLGVCELKASKKVLSRGVNSDPCVGTFAALSRVREFPMIDRLKKEKMLDPEDLYYLGFSFAEGNASEQAIGGDILSHLAQEAPASRHGKMAKNKLVSMGWEE
jgi:HEAT repeat protein